jgi:hypothetical protein
MKAPRGSGDTGTWERTLSRFLTVSGIPVQWKGHLTGFTGLSGYVIKRIAPQRSRYLSTASWAKMPEFWREHRDINNLIVIVTNRKYGDDLEDSLVVMRLGTFAPIFATHINNDRERYIDAANRDR